MIEVIEVVYGCWLLCIVVFSVFVEYVVLGLIEFFLFWVDDFLVELSVYFISWFCELICLCVVDIVIGLVSESLIGFDGLIFLWFFLKY